MHGGDQRPFEEFWTLETERACQEREVEAIAIGRFQAMGTCVAAISRLNGVECC